MQTVQFMSWPTVAKSVKQGARSLLTTEQKWRKPREMRMRAKSVWSEMRMTWDVLLFQENQSRP